VRYVSYDPDILKVGVFAGTTLGNRPVEESELICD